MAGRRRAKSKAGATISRAAPVTAPAFYVAGIGASAGGLAAFEAFFSGLPKGKLPHMAFVLVQHLAPDHQSILTDLIKGFTHLEVHEISDGMAVEPNCVYVIPPGHDIALLNGRLQLLTPSTARGIKLPIDFFFRSLAQDQGDRAIGVVLSGTGSDGAVGVRAIKAEGGLVMVQKPETTEFDGMPLSAVATGAVDYELPPGEMMAQLVAYAAHRGPRLPLAPPTPVDSTLKNIFVLLRAQTGHDFSQYKPNTVQRRVERRMAVHQVRSADEYLKYLQQTPGEVEALFRDLLIGVTSFFRDEVAFKALERAIPKLCEGKPAGSTVRIWVAGCSTGEEAYSLAMLFEEFFAGSEQRLMVQIFATDLDSRAIATARTGVYAASAVADVSRERLARFFTADPPSGSYRINKNIREQVIFSEHDVLKDPPFSKVDLLSCRNVLIYMSAELQKMLVPLFHYAIRPDGLLLLGTSEGVGDFDTLFRVIDRKAKLYRRRADQLGHVRGRTFAPMTAIEAAPKKPPVQVKLSARELIEQAILRQLAPASALVNGHGDIVYLHGRTGMFLEPAPGEAGVSNVLKMARPGLRSALSAALHRAVGKGEVVRTEAVRVKTNGHFTVINLTVAPVTEGPGTAQLESPVFLVLFEEVPDSPLAHPAPEGREQAIDARIAALREEIRIKDDYLQRTNEELETTTEELKSYNEEMQSVNEELQSTNEELETSKEELQSVNEELAVVNAELQTKVSDLSRANSDMNNLLAGTGIATVFLDRELRILRFTPAASEITNLIQSDVGRPVGHIVSNLVGYTQLVAQSQEVLATLNTREVEVQTASGNWYMLRIQPYRTLENVIEGVVMSFVDVTERVVAREMLRKVNDLLRLAVVVRDASDAITVQDLDGRILAWNPGAERLYGWTEPEALLMNARERIPQEEQAAESARLARLRAGGVLEPYLGGRRSKSGGLVPVSIVATALIDQRGETYAVATTERARE